MKTSLNPSSRIVPWALLTSAIFSLSSCAGSGAPTEPAVILGSNYVEFNVSIGYLSSFDRSTGTYDLDGRGLSFLSLKNKESYGLRGGEARSHQKDIDFVYDVSSSVRTGYLTNTGFYMPRVDGFAKSPFGEDWTDWNAKSLITHASSTRAPDPATGSRYALSDEEFDAIHDAVSFGIVNLGNNPGIPLNTPLGAQVTFDIWQDGRTDDNHYFVFTLRSGERGVLRISRDQNATSLNVKVKMLR